jgi:hypothetical protein
MSRGEIRVPAPSAAAVITAAALTLVALVTLGVAAVQAFSPQFRPTLEAVPLRGEIVIDGELDDSGWRRAAIARGFTEVSPGDQVEPPVESEAWVTYDDMHLYVALIAYDDPSAIRVSLRERDNIFRDDYFGVLIDTYGDQSRGYELFVNPLGIQGDMLIDADGSEDSSFDAVWWSEGRLTERGYQVEISVPFSSLRFPDADTQSWRVNFWRDHQRDVRRRYAWAATDRDDPCWMCQWGELTGIHGIRPGKHLDVIGSLLGTQSGSLADSDDPNSSFENAKPEGEAGLYVRYGLTSNASATLALNPDFSQVESDAGQIDVNTTTALFYPERRPFFQEGSDLFNTWIDVVYTRSINDPVVAGKLNGRFGATSLIYTVARDENTPLILPFKDQSELLTLGRSTTNIVRARHSLGDRSHIGAIVADRRLDAGGGGTALGADAQIRLSRNYNVEGQVVLSRTAEPDAPELTEDLDVERFDGLTAAFDGETYLGHALYTSFERNGRVWNLDLNYTEYSPRFRTDTGFTTHNDFREASGWTGLNYRRDGGWVLNWEPSLGFGRIWAYHGGFEDEWLRPQIYMNLRGQTEFSYNYLISGERFAEVLLPGIRMHSFWVNTRPTELLSCGANILFGQAIYRDLDAPELGNSFRVSADATIKPTERLVISPSWDYARMDSRLRPERLFEGYILRTRLTYNFTRQWFTRLIVQYNQFGERLDLEPLLTYRLNPFTVFYVGATSRVDYFADEDALDAVEDSAWKLSRQQFFTKVQYLYQF